MAIAVGKTDSSEVHYVEEIERGPEDELGFNRRSAELSVRDWDVTDPEARDAAAVLQLEDPSCPDDHWYAQHAQWFINPTLNAAVLIVYRPKVEEHA